MEEAKKAVDATKLVTMGKDASVHLQTLLQHLQSHFENQPDGNFPAEFPDGALEKLEKAGIPVSGLAKDCGEMVEQTDSVEPMELEKELTAKVDKFLVYITPCLQRELGYMKTWAAEQWTGTSVGLAAVGESGTALESIRDLRARLTMLSRALRVHGGTPRNPIFFFASLAEEACRFQEDLEALENGQEDGFLKVCFAFNGNVAKVEKQHPLDLEVAEAAMFKELHANWETAVGAL